MSEAISFLRLQTEKREELFEVFFNTGGLNGAGIDHGYLVDTLQKTYCMYQAVENLREKHSGWVTISPYRVYDTMKALVAMDALPDFSPLDYAPRGEEKGVVTGFLYVLHVFQIHSHAFGQMLNERGCLESSLHRVYGLGQEDLALWQKFLNMVRSDIGAESKPQLAKGVELAFQKIEALTKENRPFPNG